ncbi:MAG: excinuclease ABC subunit UvrA [Candidatus Pacebacteria bacterium CG10_big_fil_rev_8_21_14_0_10_36_11]|nr:excinuclease ABC subunit UvrA [Candidatus Pacearchaeota archaeon]OIP74141.1 MAG: excinuclease ABC subunit A [Candidatus Pacebacteria bacterium CG2_30_36_39]PIR64511.1 MAG: excinuclease ABC subunit UvrA [Candidatus Pacebacteria bacterium CG10_big_fil_rev_8_21_14_0_10_36_11]PJC43204.1 MAG: excinuclease ABC subunit UvrA [Candidatus Pacebacteria bacterium CG_4_9_14_0_2_um_filter_36_8]
MLKTSLDHIIISGAREHNLKNVSLSIPKNQLVVFTGLSGSGKTSLAFDTLYAEGQRRYVESLSSYARQFLGIMQKPDVDQIQGLSPAISIDQKTTSHNPRSTVGTITEIYDYLRLLFARIGHPHCPECGREVSTQSIDQIIGQIVNKLEEKADAQPTRFMILSPVIQNRKGEFSSMFNNLQKQGYSRVRIDGEVFDLNENISLLKTNKHTIEAILDRLSFSKKQLRDKQEMKTLKSRLSQTIEEALKLSAGLVVASFINDDSLNFPDKPKNMEDYLFSEKLACSHCGISIKELEPRIFSFNAPEGACATCNGLGSLLRVNSEKIIAPSLTLSEGAIIPFARTMSNDTWWARLVQTVVIENGYDFRKTTYEEMSEEFQKTLLYGSPKIYTVTGENRFGKETLIQEKFEGFITNLERRYQETDSDYIRKEIEQFMHKETCPDCKGLRLKPASLAVKIDQKNIADVTGMTIQRALDWSDALQLEKKLSNKEIEISKPILKEIVARLRFLTSVGLNYLSLSREASTLAGGEAQRIRLASQIGTGLTGVLYILDEPTIGLHPRDNDRLVETLQNLKNQGNTVIVVEHDRDVMLSSDYIFDFGPGAGKHGGSIIAEGTPEEIMKLPSSITGKYLSRKKDVTREKEVTRKIIDPDETAKVKGHSGAIQLRGATHHNLKNIDVDFPLNSLNCITGLSGSGKSTLLHDTLYHQLMKHLERKTENYAGSVQQVMIPDVVRRVSLIDQSPIGKTPRSNPATYTKIFDYIRKIFANTQEAHIRGYNPGRFSFNVKGGRCETCQGDGQIKIEMQFLPDVYVTCDVCNGQRYNEETLQVLYKGKNIAEILKLSIEDALEFFKTNSNLKQKLQTLVEVGLGYLELGQPAPTLSGGEAQRVKLARELSLRTNDHVVYLLDEPTTGLHFADVQKLLFVLHQLVSQNNTVVLIEHNLDVIKNADWIIDLGPEGGEYGGEIIATGSPQELAQITNSFTGQYLKSEFAAQKK